jgi:hypothetical protein
VTPHDSGLLIRNHCVTDKAAIVVRKFPNAVSHRCLINKDIILSDSFKWRVMSVLT